MLLARGVVQSPLSASQSHLPNGPGVSAGAGKRAHILIVDDEPANVRLLERLLRQAGYENMKSVTDPREVVNLYETFEPDLILLDLMMPHLDGVAVLQELQPKIDGRYLPILVLTADATLEARQRALAAGAKDFLTKPFDHLEALLRIKNLLETRSLYLDLERQNRSLEQIVRDRTEQLLQTEKIATMGSLLAGVAHELNNPLSVVTGHAALLLQTAKDEGLRQRGEKIRAAADRCARIIRNFLALARRRPEERTRVSLNAVVKEAVEFVAYPLRVEDVNVALSLDEALPALWADQHQLHQVLVNLVTNALHVLRTVDRPRQLAINTRFDPARGRIIVEVADNGPGVPDEIRAKIFETFFTTKPVGEGTGLGLSISRGIVEAHGGRLELATDRGPGAVFVIELPVQDAPAAAAAGSESDPVPPRACTMLVVDDEREIAEVLAEILTGDGHQVDIAADGTEALAQVLTRPYDLILSDVKMPKLDGPGLLREIERRNPALAGRFVFITGDELSPQTGTLLESLRTPRLKKPFDITAVRRTVAVALGAPR